MKGGEHTSSFLKMHRTLLHLNAITMGGGILLIFGERANNTQLCT